VEDILTDQAKLKTIIEWLSEKKAENIRVYDVHKSSSYTDLIVVCEGNADLHNKAIASYLIDQAKANKLGVISKEGVDNGQWILIDIGDVIVHIFLPQMRQYYKIDDLFEKVRTHHEQESDE
jgi:ribosome-associated protein